VQKEIEDYAHLYGRAVNSTNLLDSQQYCDKRANADAVTTTQKVGNLDTDSSILSPFKK